MGIHDNSWVDELIGENGILSSAVERYKRELAELEKAWKQSQRTNPERSSGLYRELKQLRCADDDGYSRSLIDFLARNNILPKYGFPVDTVELQIAGKRNGNSNEDLTLARDLQMAIAEYAPGSEVIADGKLYKSRYIRMESVQKRTAAYGYYAKWKPKLFFVDGKTTLQEYLAKLIKKYTAAGIKEKDIVVLSMKPEGKSMLQQSDLCISGKYILSREPKENSIFFTTVRKFKGLEAEVIICIDIDKETFSSPQERNVFYVGTSRAMAYLDLLSLSSPEELATAIDGGEIYSKRPQAIKAVRDCLKVKIASAFDLTDDMDS